MASVEQISKKLLKVLQENVDKKKGCAIAITGEWGIGKTHFWNYFKENSLKGKNEKIAYVSLFGIESLDALKYEIGIQSHSGNDTEREQESNSKFKNFFTSALSHIKIPELESGGFALSISRELITGVIGSMVKDTIICIDDLERKSDKLDLKDVMGLINQLKLEKNCQVIVILHQDKDDDEFQEYKEKVFDEIFYLTDNFDVIKEIINDDEVIDVYQEFYDKLGVKNLRFYERVHKDYAEIVSLIDDLTTTSKDSILRNLLLVRLADQFPKCFEFDDEKCNFTFDLNFVLDFKLSNYMNDEFFAQKMDVLNQFLNNFVYFGDVEEWMKIIAENIIDHNIDSDVLKELVGQDKISEQKIQVKNQLDELMIEWHNLDLGDSFANRLYDVLMNFVEINHSVDLNNASFYYEIMCSQDIDLANNFKKKVQDTIKLMIRSFDRKPALDNFYCSTIRDGDVFYDFVNDKIDKYYNIRDNYSQNDDFCDYFIAKFYDKPISRDVDLNLINKDILSKIIWSKLEERRYANRKRFIKTIIECCPNDKRDEICKWIVELLQEKIQENPNSKMAIESWLVDTEGLTKP